MRTKKQNIGLFLGPFLFIILTVFFKPKGLSQTGLAVLASAVWIATWWVTEALHIAVTALLPIVLFPLSGGLSLTETTQSYGHKYIFLFMGGFIIAIAVEKWNLHKRIALNIIKLIGTDIRFIILGFMIATAFLSMWISNTATAVMMLPIGVAIIKKLKDNPKTTENEPIVFGKALMLAIAYSASIGGMATLIGTPPNLVFSGVIKESYDVEISFLNWFIFACPISILFLILGWLYLTKFAFKFNQSCFPGGIQEINKQLKLLGKVSYEEKSVMAVFALTAFSWITRSFLLKQFIPQISDTLIAITFALILFVLPTKSKQQLMDWKDAVKLPWDILILFGGGMALALGFESSGLALWLGKQLIGLKFMPLLLLIFILVASVNFLTEITSNLATTAMLLPVLVSLAKAVEIHPFILLVSATLAASCAFMLPVATPPNAVVFGAGFLKINDMIKKGFVMNIVTIILISLFVYFILPMVWNLPMDL